MAPYMQHAQQLWLSSPSYSSTRPCGVHRTHAGHQLVATGHRPELERARPSSQQHAETQALTGKACVQACWEGIPSIHAQFPREGSALVRCTSMSREDGIETSQGGQRCMHPSLHGQLAGAAFGVCVQISWSTHQSNTSTQALAITLQPRASLTTLVLASRPHVGEAWWL